MRIVTSKVFILASTEIDEGIGDYLRDQAGEETAAKYMGGKDSDAELLIEVAGRACYRSLAPGLNPNVTKIREGNKKYIANILKQLHGSVLEHASITFAFVNVSRVFTHELCRHRAGTAISQESMRYVRLDDIPFAQSDALEEGLINHPVGPRLTKGAINTAVGVVEDTIKALTSYWDLDNCSFAEKKLKTSAMRRLAPMGTATSIIWTCNLRELRHVITLRTAEGAEEEIRKVFCMVAKIAMERYPNVFQDFTENPETGAYEPKHWKV